MDAACVIRFATPLPVGNAVAFGLTPPAGANLTQVLRNTTGKFAGPNDPGSTVVFQGLDDGFTDFSGLTNGTSYCYAEFNLVGGSWVAGDTAQVTPAAAESEIKADPLVIVRDRLAAGVANEVSQGRLQPGKSGAIKVYTAPPQFDADTWPVVSVHLRSDSPSSRGLGEDLYGEAFDPIGQSFIGTEGWLSDVSLDIVGWALNPDVRIALRQALKRILLSNLPVFEAAGMMQVAFTFADQEDFESYNAPVYSVAVTLTCVAAAVVTASIAEPLSDANAVASLP